MLDERPTATELLAAVAAFLEEKAAPALPPHEAYHAKVAANAVHIVLRELERGEAASREDLARLAALTGEPIDAGLRALNAALCARIERGELATDDAALREHLLASVLARIAIDSPRYPSLAASTGSVMASTARRATR